MTGYCCGCGCDGTGSGGCCAGVQVVTPRVTVNRPGLPAIGHRPRQFTDVLDSMIPQLGRRPGLPAIGSRPGKFTDFLDSMIARLGSRPELTGYTTRDSGDPGIALLDCWALAAYIVAFYAERAVNEGYLGTATQP